MDDGAREPRRLRDDLLESLPYNILYSRKLADVGAANPGPRAIDMLTLDRPTLQFTDLAKGMGVPGGKARTISRS